MLPKFRHVLLINNVPSQRLKHACMAKNKSRIRLTNRTLQALKDNGYQFVLVKGYGFNQHPDYLQLNYFTLVPVKTLPQEPGEKEIYAPIDSEVLTEWANSPDNELEAYIQLEPGIS